MAIPIKNNIIAVDNCVRVKILDGFKNQGKNAATEFDIISIDISFKAAHFLRREISSLVLTLLLTLSFGRNLFFISSKM